MIRFPILLAVLVLFVTNAVSAQSSSRDDVALSSLIKQMAAAQVAFDAVALDKFFTPDYIEISPVGEFDSRAKVLGFYKPENKPSTGMIPALEVTDFSVRIYGKFAIVIAKLTYTVSADPNAGPPRSMRGTFVCPRAKGAWKIASAQYTGIRPPRT